MLFGFPWAQPMGTAAEDKRRVRLRIYSLGSLAADWLVPPAKGPAPIRWFFSYNLTKHIVEIENYRSNYLGSAIIEIIIKALSHTFWETLSRNHSDKDYFNNLYYSGVLLKLSEQIGDSDGKESVCSVGDLGLIPGSGRSPGEGNGHPLQYSCLENSMDRGTWWVMVHGVSKSWTLLSD